MVLLAIPSVLMFSELWAAEVTVLMGGRLVAEVDTNENEVNVSAMAIVQNLTMMFMTLMSSMLSAVATRTGTFLGAGRARSARRTITAGSLTLMLIVLVINVFLLVFRRGVARVFATEGDLIDLLSNLVFTLAAYCMLQAPAMALMGAMTGCGRQVRRLPPHKSVHLIPAAAARLTFDCPPTSVRRVDLDRRVLLRHRRRLLVAPRLLLWLRRDGPHARQGRGQARARAQPADPGGAHGL